MPKLSISPTQAADLIEKTFLERARENQSGRTEAQKPPLFDLTRDAAGRLFRDIAMQQTATLYSDAVWRAVGETGCTPGAILLVGRAGAGKTTTAKALAAAGSAYNLPTFYITEEASCAAGEAIICTSQRTKDQLLSRAQCVVFFPSQIHAPGFWGSAAPQDIAAISRHGFQIPNLFLGNVSKEEQPCCVFRNHPPMFLERRDRSSKFGWSFVEAIQTRSPQEWRLTLEKRVFEEATGPAAAPKRAARAL